MVLVFWAAFFKLSSLGFLFSVLTSSGSSSFWSSTSKVFFKFSSSDPCNVIKGTDSVLIAAFITVSLKSLFSSNSFIIESFAVLAINWKTSSSVFASDKYARLSLIKSFFCFSLGFLLWYFLFVSKSSILSDKPSFNFGETNAGLSRFIGISMLLVNPNLLDMATSSFDIVDVELSISSFNSGSDSIPFSIIPLIFSPAVSPTLPLSRETSCNSFVTALSFESSTSATFSIKFPSVSFIETGKATFLDPCLIIINALFLSLGRNLLSTSLSSCCSEFSA